jgi:hypothetical protein
LSPHNPEFKVQQIVEKLFWESFDVAQDERRISEMIAKFPFVLRFSKHSESFFNSLSKLVQNEVKDLVARSKDPSKLRTGEAPH